MKKRIVSLTSAIMVLCFVLAQTATPKPASAAETADKAQEEIKQLEEERNQALLKGDAAAIERMTSEDYTFINQRGELRTRAEIVAGFKSGMYKYDARQLCEVRVRVYGDTAVVTGRA